ncbi:MAG: hypothetical protein QGI45_02030 [Myxococcota bacterium]|jgi:hypothetical protein|nr:hypothetical protein [Myxococcota bacterium]
MALKEFFSKWMDGDDDGAPSNNKETQPKANPNPNPSGSLPLSESLTQRRVEITMLPEDYETEEIVKTFLEECGVQPSDKVIVPLLQARLLLAMVLAHRICVQLRHWDRKCEIDLESVSGVILDQLPQLVGAQKQDEIELVLKNLETEIWRCLVQTKTWSTAHSLTTREAKMLAA